MAKKKAQRGENRPQPPPIEELFLKDAPEAEEFLRELEKLMERIRTRYVRPNWKLKIDSPLSELEISFTDESDLQERLQDQLSWDSAWLDRYIKARAKKDLRDRTRPTVEERVLDLEKQIMGLIAEYHFREVITGFLDEAVKGAAKRASELTHQFIDKMAPVVFSDGWNDTVQAQILKALVRPFDGEFEWRSAEWLTDLDEATGEAGRPPGKPPYTLEKLETIRVLYEIEKEKQKSAGKVKNPSQEAQWEVADGLDIDIKTLQGILSPAKGKGHPLEDLLKIIEAAVRK